MNDEFLTGIARVSQMLPSSAPSLTRLVALPALDSPPRIAVFGKYNHGKSTLLNALIGYEHFRASDKRETTEVDEFEHDGVVWIDTPGLDADVSREDDRKARGALSLDTVDIVCLVHSVDSGELDHSEVGIYREIQNQDHSPAAKVILVLTCIDQAHSSDDIGDISSRIREQLNEIELRDAPIFPLSARRYQRGLDEDKASFIKASGVPDFLSRLEYLKTDINRIRRLEVRRLLRKARSELTTQVESMRKQLAGAQFDYAQRERNFQREILEINRKLIGRAEDKPVSIPGTIDAYTGKA